MAVCQTAGSACTSHEGETNGKACVGGTCVDMYVHVWGEREGGGEKEVCMCVCKQICCELDAVIQAVEVCSYELSNYFCQLQLSIKGVAVKAQQTDNGKCAIYVT